jgi:hypothetical protein
MTPFNNSPKLIGSRENPLQATDSFPVKNAATIGVKNPETVKVQAVKYAQSAAKSTTLGILKNIQNGPLTSQET